MRETFTRKQILDAVTKARQDFTFAGEVLLDRLKQENEALQRQLAEKDEALREATSELKLIKERVDESGWHWIADERMKRVLYAQTAIDRLAAIIAKHEWKKG